MLVYNIGLSAIQANQAALQTISNNIANANTQGYHRQQVTLAQANPIVQNYLQFGTGVNVSQIRRVVDSAADSALTLNLSQSADAQTKLEALRAIEGLLTPTSGSLTSTVSKFFDSIEKLSTTPADTSLRQEVVAAAQDVASQISALNQGLDQLQHQQGQAVRETVEQINSLTTQIAAVNKQIRLIEAGGGTPNTLLDQRDQLVQDLGKLVDISPGSFVGENSTLVAAGGWLVVGDSPQKLTVVDGGNGSLQIQIGQRGPVEPVGGKLAGLLSVNNEIIPSVSETLQSWTSALVSGVNSAQVTGLGLSGPVSSLGGTTHLLQSNVPLSATNTLLPVAAGSLFVSVTNSTTGDRKTVEVAVDPAIDSLDDVISRLNAVPNLNASRTANGQLRLEGAAGFLIDFAGRPDSQVDASTITGTAVPQISGVYSGQTNSNWSVSAVSSGQVGVTSGLSLRVTNTQTGELVRVLSIGSGYAANQPIEIENGLFIQLDAGTLNAGDNFQVKAIVNPDSSGLLTALGVGGIFQTHDLRTVTVDERLLKDPGLIAASRTGHVGDGSQLQRISRVRSASILSGGTETIEERLGSITSNAGLAVNSYEARVQQLQSQYDQVRSRQDAVSGVDPNEELMAMLQFQRAFQANAKFVSTIDKALDDLLGILR